MECIGAPTRGLTMQPLSLAAMAAALRLGDPGFQSAKEPTRFQTVAVARDRDVFQSAAERFCAYSTQMR